LSNFEQRLRTRAALQYCRRRAPVPVHRAALHCTTAPWCRVAPRGLPRLPALVSPRGWPQLQPAAALCPPHAVPAPPSLPASKTTPPAAGLPEGLQLLSLLPNSCCCRRCLVGTLGSSSQQEQQQAMRCEGEIESGRMGLGVWEMEEGWLVGRL